MLAALAAALLLLSGCAGSYPGMAETVVVYYDPSALPSDPPRELARVQQRTSWRRARVVAPVPLPGASERRDGRRLSSAPGGAPQDPLGGDSLASPDGGAGLQPNSALARDPEPFEPLPESDEAIVTAAREKMVMIDHQQASGEPRRAVDVLMAGVAIMLGLLLR